MSDPNQPFGGQPDQPNQGWGQGGWGNQPSGQQPPPPSDPQPQPPTQPQDPQWGGQPQDPQVGGQPGFGQQPQPGFGQQPQPGFDQQPQPGFGQQPAPGFGQGPGFPAQPKKRKIWPWIVGAIVLIVAVVAILQATGVIATSTNVQDLGVGDCVLIPDEIEIANLDTFPCDRPHDGEVVGLVTADGGDDAPYPGEDAFFDQAVRDCIPIFESYTGTSFDDSPFDIFFLQPTPDGWADGDRGITCIANRLDGAQIEGSIRE